MQRALSTRGPLVLASLLAVLLALFGSGPRFVPVAAAAGGAAGRTLEEYRQFRALSIDILGRFPTRAEIEELERPGFDREAWVQKHLSGPAYAERLTRIYMDVLRLEVGNAVNVTPAATTLRREQVQGPDGKPIYVYYRRGQRRAREATDGEFCLSKDESGLEFPQNQPPRGTAIPVKKAVLDAETTLVRPWWLYRDFLQVSPQLRYGAGWNDADAAFVPGDRLLKEPDGTETVEVRVCKEEAQTRDMGTLHATGRVPPPPGTPPPHGRLKPLPLDDGYTKTHKGEALSCRDAMAVTSSIDCGCGIGLQYCTPGDGNGDQPNAFALPSRTPLGDSAPLPRTVQSISAWHKHWWSAEVLHFFGRIFAEDRDFREVLTARGTEVNGPLAQFYRATSAARCCSRERAFGMNDELEPLFDTKVVPPQLFPNETGTWLAVPERSAHASGLLTMPVFLEKFASRRARAAAVYTAFQCKSFVSTNAELKPSTEPNLMVRPGCAGCHATLEPLAAYFSRIEETSTVYLPESKFPLKNPACKLGKNGKAPGFCDAFYDPAFGDANAGLLRGAYASAEHAKEGPQGLADMVVRSPEFASCAVSRVTASFLGRPLSSDDDALVQSLTGTFTKAGYRMRPLVLALVRSDAYRKANNLRSGTPRQLPTEPAVPDDAVHGGTK